MNTSSVAFQMIRILFLGVFSTGLGIALTPLLTNFLYKHHLGKQIRQDKNAPIFMSLHKDKAGTPTMGGILMWGTTLIIAFLFFILSRTVDGFWGSIDFISRSQTWLPLGAMVGAAAIGLWDDFMGVFHRGSKGGGLKMRDKVLIYKE